MLFTNLLNSAANAHLASPLNDATDYDSQWTGCTTRTPGRRKKLGKRRFYRKTSFLKNRFSKEFNVPLKKPYRR